MLRWRIVSALVLIAILAGAIWLDLQHPLWGLGGLWLLPLAVAATALGSIEVCRLVLRDQNIWQMVALALGNVLIVCSAAVPLFWNHLAPGSPSGQLGWPMVAFVLALAIAFAATMRSYHTGDPAISRLGRTVLALSYVGLLPSFFVALRLVGGHREGMVALLSLFVIVKLSDVGAYLVGRLLGGKVFGGVKFAPQLSPKKTVEGAVGAIVAACIGSWLTFAHLGPWLTGAEVSRTQWWAWLTFGAVLAVAGMFGDLAESLLKREAGIKDSGGGWLPGLGGVLDLMDSLLFAAPVAYLFWTVELVRV